MKLRRKRIRVDYVFDIETEDWSKFVCGCVLDVATDEIFEFRSEGGMAQWIFDHPGHYWSHNGGRYDMLWLLKHIRFQGIPTRVFATSMRITLMKIADSHEMRDSAALIPLSLKKMAAIGGTTKLAVGLACVCPPDRYCWQKDPINGCGGYCRIRVDMPEEDYVQILTYCAQDCRAAAKSLLALQDFADVRDLDLCGTVGASAYRTAKRRLQLKDAAWEARHYNLARAGYYGGRTQVFRPGSPSGNAYDINSAYPAALSFTSLPVGPISEVAGQQAERLFRANSPGLYTALVHVQTHTFIPPLPCRDTQGRLRFPIGTFSGTWTQLELANAERHGAEIRGFGLSLVFADTTTELQTEVRRIWAMRAELGKEHPISGWIKFDANSFTGKFAQSPISQSVVLGMRNPKPCPGDAHCMGILCGSSIGCCLHRCTGQCGAFEPLGFASDAWVRTDWKIPANGHIAWAAYLTSVTRIQLFQRLYEAGTASVYCDTDGIKSEYSFYRGNGKELGEWAEEGQYENWECPAPKTYRYWDVATQKWIVKSKGIAEPIWADLMAGRPALAGCGVLQFRSAIRAEAKGRSMFEKKELYRRLRFDGLHYGDRVLDGDITRPTTMTGEMPWAR